MSRNVLAAMTAVVSVAPALAEPLQRITLEEALEMFEANNVELLLAAAERDEALGRARQARARPNPDAAVSHEGLSEGGLDYSESYFTLSQRFEWPGRRSARAEASEREASAVESRLQAERRRLAFEVKRTFIEAATAEERASVIDDVLAVFRMAEASGRERLREGDLSGYDARRLRIARARYERLTVSAQADVRSARFALASLILPGDELSEIAPSGPPVGTPPSVRAVDEKAAVSLALARRSDLEGAEARVAAAEASVRYLSTFTRPDVTLTGGYKRQSDGFDGYFLALNVPLPTLDRRTGDVEAAEGALRAAAAKASLLRRSIENDVRRALSAYAALSERIPLVRDELLSDVGDLLRIARVSYSEGEMSPLELLDAAEAFRESRIMNFDLGAELWIRYYDLERAMGGSVTP